MRAKTQTGQSKFSNCPNRVFFFFFLGGGGVRVWGLANPNPLYFLNCRPQVRQLDASVLRDQRRMRADRGLEMCYFGYLLN